MSRFGSGLRFRLILLVFLATAPAAGLLIANVVDRRHADADAADAEARKVLDMVLVEHEAVVLAARQLLQVLASLPEARALDITRCDALFRTLLDQNPAFANVGMTDAEGVGRASALPLAAPVPAHDRLWFQRARDSGRFATGGFQIGRVTGIPTVSFSLPVYAASGEFRGVVFVAVALTTFTRAVERAPRPEGARMMAFDREGRVLVSLSPSSEPIGADVCGSALWRAAAAARAEVFDAPAPDGVSCRWTRATLRAGGEPVDFLLLLGQPYEALYAAANRALLRDLLWLALAAALAYGAAWVFGDRLIVRRVGALLEVVRRITAGDYSARTGLSGGSGELDRLARGVDTMAAELQRRDERLRESTRNYQHAFQYSAMGIGVAALSGTLRAINPAFCAFLGYTEAELLARDVRPFTHPEDQPRDAAETARLLAGECGAFQCEKRFIRKDGAVVWGAQGASLVRDERGNAVHFIFHVQNITARRQAEENLARTEAMLLQSQKMEAVGRLAGGVAHDFNNVLTVISGCASMALANLPPGDATRPALEEIGAAGERAATLTRQLLAFSRRQVLQPVVLDLGELLRGMERLVLRLVGDDVRARLEVTPGLWPVRADRGQIEQVVMNLVVNARDAMPEGGALTIEARNAHVDASSLQRGIPVEPGDFVLLAVTDTGVGMDAAVQARLFEPFFTTKEAPKGTGLGLATVYGIVKQSGGHVAVASEVGQGSTFKVYLPRVAAEPLAPRARPAAPAPFPLLPEKRALAPVEPSAPAAALPPAPGAGGAGGPPATTPEADPAPGPLPAFPAFLVPTGVGPGMGGAALFPPRPALGAGRTALVAEDDERVRPLVRRVLGEAGFQVMEASGGAEAVRQAIAQAGPLHLLVTDIVMAGMHGIEAAERVRAIHPETRVLFTSGHAEPALLARVRGLQDDRVAFLLKPFTPDALLAKVREMLEGQP